MYGNCNDYSGNNFADNDFDFNNLFLQISKEKSPLYKKITATPQM